MRRRSVGDRPGFSLVEVLVALVVSALVVAGARALVDGLSDASRSVAARATATDRAANGAALLRALARRVEVGTARERTFDGFPDHAAFTSWCDTPAGWQLRCRVTLTIDSAIVGLRLATDRDEEHTVVDTAAVRLIYLEDANGGGRWFNGWGSGLTAPLAIGVVGRGDTTIVRIGGRG